MDPENGGLTKTGPKGDQTQEETFLAKFTSDVQVDADMLHATVPLLVLFITKDWFEPAEGIKGVKLQPLTSEEEDAFTANVADALKSLVALKNPHINANLRLFSDISKYSTSPLTETADLNALPYWHGFQPMYQNHLPEDENPKADLKIKLVLDGSNPPKIAIEGLEPEPITREFDLPSVILHQITHTNLGAVFAAGGLPYDCYDFLEDLPTEPTEKDEVDAARAVSFDWQFAHTTYYHTVKRPNTTSNQTHMAWSEWFNALSTKWQKASGNDTENRNKWYFAQNPAVRCEKFLRAWGAYDPEDKNFNDTHLIEMVPYTLQMLHSIVIQGLDPKSKDIYYTGARWKELYDYVVGYLIEHKFAEFWGSEYASPGEVKEAAEQEDTHETKVNEYQ